MISGTLSARSYRVALLFAGQPEMKREKNLKFYDDLTGQAVDFSNFEQKPNEIVLQNIGSENKNNVVAVSVGRFNDRFRLFIMEDFPNKTMEMFNRVSDAAWKSFQKVWKLPEQSLSLAEVTLRYTAAAKGGNATDFLLNSCLRAPKESLNHIGRQLSGVGFKLISPVLITNEKDKTKIPLANADFNVHIETLIEDPSLLYIQVTTKWPSLPLPAARTQDGPEGVPSFLNPSCHEPSWYLKHVEEFVKGQIESFLCAADK